LLEHVDNGDLAFLAAYQLSFIDDETIQERITDFILEGGTIGIKRAAYLRGLYANGIITIENIREFLRDDITPKRSVTLCETIVDRYFALHLSKHEVLKGVVVALQFYADNMAGGGDNAS
jgi:ParB family chromosome partitioning protein